LLTSAIYDVEWLAPNPGRFIPSNITSVTHIIISCVSPRAGVDPLEEIPLLLISNDRAV